MSSKIECTAVNELIDLVQQKPLARDSGVELLFAPPREANPRRQVDGTPAPRGLFAVELPVAPAHAGRPPFEPTPRRGDAPARGTSELPVVVKKFGVPAGILVMVGLGVGAAISLSRHASTGTPIDYVAAFTPPKVVVALPPPAPPKLAFVDVMLASTPPGATATLLDHTTGASTPLGSTPVEASLDPTKQYDVRFELAGHRATTEHLDPATSKHLEVALAEPDPATDPAHDPAATAAAATPPPTRGKQRHHHAAAQHATRRLAMAQSARHGHRNDGVAALAALGPAKHDGTPGASGAPGTLSITTSVPCAILIDGANTGKTSPTRLSVPAGHHSVRLIAATEHINKQVSVDITAKKTTRLNQTF